MTDLMNSEMHDIVCQFDKGLIDSYLLWVRDHEGMSESGPEFEIFLE